MCGTPLCDDLSGGKLLNVDSMGSNYFVCRPFVPRFFPSYSSSVVLYFNYA